MNKQNLSHGFSYGVNNITVSKILYWLKSDVINWEAFLWYIADYVTIVDFDENLFKVNIYSDKQLNFFYKMVRKYQVDICENNYDVDIRNELWKDHKKGSESNFKILSRLAKQTETK